MCYPNPYDLGLGTYIQKSKTIARSFGGVYNDGDNVLAAQFDNNVCVE